MNVNKTLKGLLMTGLMLLAGTSAMAAAPNSDSLTIRITPNVDLGVDIDSATARFNNADAPGDLDIPLDLNATTYLISPASVTITGNYGNQEVEVVGQANGGWSLDTDENIGADSVQVYALFAVDKTTNPAESDFSGTNNLVTTTPQMAGQPVGDEATPGVNQSYEKAIGMISSAQMDNLALAALRQLWLRIDAPSTTTDDSAKDITVTLTARNGNSN